MAMRWIFWGFCRNWFLMSPLHYLSGRSDFGFQFAEIFIFEKGLLAITDMGSCRLRVSVTRGFANRQLRVSVMRGVGDSPYHWYAESPIEFFKRKLSVSMIPRVVDSLHQWYGESPTPRIVESESRRLRVSPIRRVDDSVYRWVGESMTPRVSDMGSRNSKKNLIWCRFSGLLTAKACL